MTGRIVVIGRNSSVWKRLCEHKPTETERAIALSHTEVAGTEIGLEDTVWIFSYSREAGANSALFAALKAKGAAKCCYLSTATANVADITRCYSYPRAKAEAEADARGLLNAKIVRVGLVYRNVNELPGGFNAATSLDEIASAMFGSADSADTSHYSLFRMVERPFHSTLEHKLFRLYGILLNAAGPFPCLLRPLDLLLRAAGIRWYGYLYLSNKLWLRNR